MESWTLTGWSLILTLGLSVIVSLIGGALLGFKISKKKTMQYLEENPPITEKQIRAMYMSMGRKPSESQVRQTLKAMGLKK